MHPKPKSPYKMEQILFDPLTEKLLRSRKLLEIADSDKDLLIPYTKTKKEQGNESQLRQEVKERVEM